MYQVKATNFNLKLLEPPLGFTISLPFVETGAHLEVSRLDSCAEFCPFLPVVLNIVPIRSISLYLGSAVHAFYFQIYVLQAREELNLTHFFYNEWPGTSDENGTVPSATHGLLGLVEHALAHQEEASLTGPIAVHCR